MMIMDLKIKEYSIIILLLLCLYGCNAEKNDNNGFI